MIGLGTQQEKALELETGWLCLDFANTVEWRDSDRIIEALNTYTDLVEWVKSIGLLMADDAEHLLNVASRHLDKAAKVFERAITLREATYHIFSAVAAGQHPQPADLTIMNAVLHEALAHLQIGLQLNDYTWEWIGDHDSLDKILWPVASSAAILLTSQELSRVGECVDQGCGWLFMDVSKNRGRRYCGYSCANRAKARRHYARKKKVTS